MCYRRRDVFSEEGCVIQGDELGEGCDRLKPDVLVLDAD